MCGAAASAVVLNVALPPLSVAVPRVVRAVQERDRARRRPAPWRHRLAPTEGLHPWLGSEGLRVLSAVRPWRHAPHVRSIQPV